MFVDIVVADIAVDMTVEIVADYTPVDIAVADNYFEQDNHNFGFHLTDNTVVDIAVADTAVDTVVHHDTDRFLVADYQDYILQVAVHNPADSNSVHLCVLKMRKR